MNRIFREDKKYVPQGKYGTALIGSNSSKTYELILYKDKQNILCRTLLCAGFTYKLQKDNFASFHDEKKQNWLLRFESPEDFNEMQEMISKYGGRIVDKTKLETKPPVEPEDKKEIEVPSEVAPVQVKTNVLARMAKMGHSVLPVVANKDEEESSESEEEEKKVEVKPVRKPRKSVPEKTRDFSGSQREPLGFSTQMVSLPSSNIFPQPQLFMSPSNLPPVCDLNTFLGESRTSNSEMRLQLTHLSNKLDEVLWKVDKNAKGNGNGNDTRCLQSKIKALELKVENLEKELLEKSGAYLLLEKESDALKVGCQATDKNLQEEIDNLRELLLIQENVVEDLKKKLSQKEAAFIEKETQLNAVNCVKAYLESAILSLKSPETIVLDFESFLETVKDCDEFRGTDQQLLVDIISDTKKKLVNLERYYTENHMKSTDMSNKAAAYREKVEQVMTHLYHHTVKHLAPAGDNLPIDFTKKIFPRNVKTATSYILREFRKDFNLPNAFDEVQLDKNNVSELDDSVIDLSD